MECIILTLYNATKSVTAKYGILNFEINVIYIYVPKNLNVLQFFISLKYLYNVNYKRVKNKAYVKVTLILHALHCCYPYVFDEN